MRAAVITETAGLELCVESKFRYNEGIYIYSYKTLCAPEECCPFIIFKL